MNDSSEANMYCFSKEYVVYNQLYLILFNDKNETCKYYFEYNYGWIEQGECFYAYRDASVTIEKYSFYINPLSFLTNYQSNLAITKLYVYVNIIYTICNANLCFYKFNCVSNIERRNMTKD